MCRTLYPVSDYLGAVDLMVTNAGYNSFHECVFGGIPSIFVPNQAPEMDDQHLRATYAYASGLGLRLRASELSRAKRWSISRCRTISVESCAAAQRG